MKQYLLTDVGDPRGARLSAEMKDGGKVEEDALVLQVGVGDLTAEFGVTDVEIVIPRSVGVELLTYLLTEEQFEAAVAAANGHAKELAVNRR